MSLEENVMSQMKDAMKAKDEALLRGLRAIKAEIIKAKTDPGAKTAGLALTLQTKNGRESHLGGRTGPPHGH